MHQLRAASTVGLRITRTILTNNPTVVGGFYEALQGRVIAKATSLHFVELNGRVYDIFARRLREEDLKALPQVQHAPHIFQEYIEKLFEVRVTVAGEQTFATAIDSQMDESYHEDYHRGSLVSLPKREYHLPELLRRKCLELVRRLNLRLAALDFIVTVNEDYVFLEVNSGPAWRWIERDTGQPITQAVVDLLVGQWRMNDV